MVREKDVWAHNGSRDHVSVWMSVQWQASRGLELAFQSRCPRPPMVKGHQQRNVT